MGWIKPSEKLPKPMKYVLIVHKWYDSFYKRERKTYEVAFRDENGQWSGNGYGGEVLAWMELPKMPKEGEL